MVKLKQMGGYFCLNGKKTGLPLCMEEDLSSSEMCSIEELIVNQRHIQFFNSKDSCFIRKANKYMCNVENCNNLDEFCILTKHDFPCEYRMKDVIFGQTFENHDSNDIIRHCFNAITLGQTLWMILVLYKAQMQLTETTHLQYQWVIGRLICTEN